MTRKTTAYARRRAHTQRDPTNGFFLNVIQRARPYTDEPIPGSSIEGTQSTADASKLRVAIALQGMVNQALPSDDTEAFDLLAHAIGVSIIRAYQIGGDRTEALLTLQAGTAALREIRNRRDRIGRWGTTRPEQIALTEAVETYEVILQSSSPAQMAKATELRMESLRAMGFVENTTNGGGQMDPPEDPDQPKQATP